jgi:replicative DNA helicase
MPAYGESFLSKLLDDGNIRPVREFNVKESDFPTKVEKQAYRFITDYAKQNGGRTPDFRTVIERVPDFYYREGVTDSYRYLANEIKSYSAKMKVVELFHGNPDDKGRPTQPTVNELINEKHGDEAISDLISELEYIRMRTSVRERVGTDLKRDAKKIKEEYERRKAGESYRVWKSWFSFINETAGGYVSSNIYVPYGKSGRGKSAVTLMEAINLAMQGATVLIWAMEMGWYELFVRIFTYYSRIVGGVGTTEVKGVNMDVGFNSRDIRNGQLNEDFEDRFFEFLEQMNELLDGNIIVRGVDDEDFSDRSLNALESDIIQTEADVVVIDPFYYLDYEANTSRKTGGDAENTSKKLRRLSGSMDVVVFAITQADETDEEIDEAGSREIKLPERKDVKKTSQLLEDAALLIAIDTNYKDGRGMVGLNKGREGGEGEYGEIIYLPQYGIIEELSIDEAELFAAIDEF